VNVLFISNYGSEIIGSTQEYLIRVMKKRGQVYHLRPRDGNILSQIVKNKIPPVDYILMFEGELDHAPEVAKLKIPKVWWFYDSIVLFNQQVDWANKTDADICFIRDQRDLPRFKSALNCKTFWLTMGYDETLWRPMPIKNRYNIGFIGWVSQERGILLNKLAAGGRLVFAHTKAENTWGETKFLYDNGERWDYDKCSELYSSSDLGFHHAFRGDATWRPLEVSGCGTACLTDYMDGLEQMFDIKNELILYKDEKEMLQLADYYLEHAEEREKIAKAAYDNVVKNHTWNARLDRIEEEIKKL
jgi:glycosyltransferase involved in cell wall biosynthesis